MFRFLTAGESHGKALTVIIEGLPAGLPLTEDYIALDLRRRQGGYGRGQRQQIEEDRAEILSGVRHGLTLGSPLSLVIRNRDWPNWQDLMQVEPAAEAADKLTGISAGRMPSIPLPLPTSNATTGFGPPMSPPYAWTTKNKDMTRREQIGPQNGPLSWLAPAFSIWQIRAVYSMTWMFFFLHMSFSIFGQTVALTSPMWAFFKRSINVRDLPMPPPMLSGSSLLMIPWW